MIVPEGCILQPPPGEPAALGAFHNAVEVGEAICVALSSILRERASPQVCIDDWGSMCRGLGNLILASPAILQETFTTIAVYPGWEARLGPEQKLEVARRLRQEALTLEESWLRTRHPDEDDTAIRGRLLAWQLHGHAWLD